MNSQNITPFSMSAQSGSSLIGVAILTLVMGFLMTGAIYLMQNYDVINADQESIDTIQAIQKAIDTYVTVEGRYPCPAPQNAAPDTAGFGIEDCSLTVAGGGRDGLPVLLGTIPVRTLNIPDKMIVDGYRKRHIYAITQAHTVAGTDIKNEPGAIYFRDENGTTISQVDGHVVYALMSHGSDDRGAYDIQGNLLEVCATSTFSGNNCDNNNAIFRSTSTKVFQGKANDFTHSFAFKANPIAYNWSTGPWSECGTDSSNTDWNNNPHPIPSCFSSYQARTVNCIDRNGTSSTNPTVDCGHTPPPAIDRSCTIGPCRWAAPAWPACSGTPSTPIGGGSGFFEPGTSDANGNGQVDSADAAPAGSDFGGGGSGGSGSDGGGGSSAGGGNR